MRCWRGARNDKSSSAAASGLARRLSRGAAMRTCTNASVSTRASEAPSLSSTLPPEARPPAISTNYVPPHMPLPSAKNALDLSKLVGLCQLHVARKKKQAAPNPRSSTLASCTPNALAKSVDTPTGRRFRFFRPSNSDRLPLFKGAQSTSQKPPRAKVDRTAETLLQAMIAPPLFLLLLWQFVVKTIANSAAPAGPVIQPYAGLALSVLSFIPQCCLASQPISRGLVVLSAELPPMLEGAFDAMLQSLPDRLEALLAKFRLPEIVRKQLLGSLMALLKPALMQAWDLLPDAGEEMPPRWKEHRKLWPLVTALLLLGLFFGQALALLELGLFGAGDLCIVFALCIHGLLFYVAFKADVAPPLVVRLVEKAYNVALQYTLHKLLDVEQLQKLLDVVADPTKDVPKIAMPQTKSVLVSPQSKTIRKAASLRSPRAS